MLLPLADQLPQAVERSLDLIDNGATRGCIIAGDEGKIPLTVVAILEPSHRAIHTGPQRGDRIRDQSAEDVATAESGHILERNLESVPSPKNAPFLKYRAGPSGSSSPDHLGNRAFFLALDAFSRNFPTSALV